MHAMQVSNIKNYLVDDTVFNATNKLFLSLDPDEVKRKNCLLDKALTELIELMKSQNPLFKKTFNRIEWTGSFYKKTKIESPDEYDLNFVINLPIKEKDMKLTTDKRYPGYVKICTTIDKTSQCKTSNMTEQEYVKIMSFVDNGALNQEKFRRWIEGVLSKVANMTNQSNQIKIENCTIIIKKAGPAFTLLPDVPGESAISIDLVPVLAFPYSCLPPHYKKYNLQSSQEYWFAVPKPLKSNNACDENYYWRLSFYKYEKDLLSKHGRAKPIIRQLKKLKETQGWKSIASYYVETLCFHNIHIFENSGKIPSNTSLLFTMLQQLLESFRQKRINHFLEEKLNLLENIGDHEMFNMERRLASIIKDIERRIAVDRFAIAKYILNDNELCRLRNELTNVPGTSETLEPGPEPEPEPEPELESMNQWRCAIV